MPSRVSTFYLISHSPPIKFWIIIYVVILFISQLFTKTTCSFVRCLLISLDKSLEQFLREWIWIMYFTSQWIVPIWNQDVGIMFAMDSSCYTLLAVLHLTIWLPGSYTTTSVGYNWAVSRIFTKSTQHIFPMVSTGILNSVFKCFVKLICLLRISYFLYCSM